MPSSVVRVEISVASEATMVTAGGLKPNKKNILPSLEAQYRTVERSKSVRDLPSWSC